MTPLGSVSPAVHLVLGFLLPVLGLAVTAYVLGRILTRRLVLPDPLERWAVATALGLALGSHLLLLLGFLHLLRPVPILLLAAGVHAVGIPVWRELAGDLRTARPGLRWALAVVAVAPFILLALYPPTAFDATLYHLPFARAFAESGGVPYLPDRRVPVFPQANEVLFTAVMLFGRDVAAHGVQLLATLASAALAAAWAWRAWPERRWAGWLAAGIFLGNPIAVHLAGSAYIEPGLTLFVTAAFYALDRWREEGGRGWLVLSAVFAATACDVKYLGLFFAGVLGLVVIFAGGAGGRSRPASARLRDALVFGGICLAFLAPWYLRIYAFNGNPLFPYLPRIFGFSLWNPVVPEAHQTGSEHLVRWLRLPWDLVFNRQDYNFEPPFSPVYLAAIPLLAFGAFRDRLVRLALLIAGLYGLVFTFLPPDGRYLEPVLPLAALAVAGSVAVAWPRRLPRAAAGALCLLCFLPGWLYAGFRVWRQGPLPVTGAERDTYLSRALPAYPAIAWLNRTRGRAYTLWALHAENMTYFADGRFLGDWFGPAGYVRVLDHLQSAEDLYRRLRRLGADHLLVPTAKEGLPFPEDGEFRRWFAPVYVDSGARVFALRAEPRETGAVRSR